MKEAVEELENLKIINKTSAEDFSEAERNKLIEDTLLSLQDVNICLDQIFISFSQSFEIDLQEIEEKSRSKMIAKGYLSKRE